MRPSPPCRRPLRHERGEITWVTLVLLAVVSSAAYLAWVWIPVYVVHYEVKQVVRDYMNQAVHNRNDDELREKMAHKIRTLDTVERLDARGELEKAPAVDLRPEDVTWERDADATPPMLHVAFEYTREVTYPWIGKTATLALAVDLSNDLTRPDWGPER